MTEQTTDEQAIATDPLESLSDDEIMGMSDEAIANLYVGAEDDTQTAEGDTEEETPEEDSGDSDSREEESSEEEETAETEEETEVIVTEEDAEDGVTDTTETDNEEEEESTEKKVETSSNLDAETQAKIDGYNRVLGKFTANGVDTQVDSVDDAIKLMQMGMGFHKKMSEIKPLRKVGKTLQNNGLLGEEGEEQLNYLIDLKNHNPEAIKKLIKDSGIDPLDLGTKSNTEYKPNIHTASDLEVDLTEALSSIKDTPSGERTIDIVSNEWDKSSRQAMAQSPAMFGVINQHVANGQYDEIKSKMELDRALGKLDGLSDLEAYHKTGEALYAGKESKDQSSEEPKPTSTKAEPAMKPKKSNTSAKKRAAKTPNGNNGLADFSIEKLGDLSDEEFDKEFAKLSIKP